MANIEPVEECFGTKSFWEGFKIRVRQGAIPKYIGGWDGETGDEFFSSIDCNGLPEDFRKAELTALHFKHISKEKDGRFHPVNPVEYSRNLQRQRIGGRHMLSGDFVKSPAMQLDPADHLAEMKRQQEMYQHRRVAVDIEVRASDLVPSGQAYIIGQSLAMLNSGDMVKSQGAVHDSMWFDEAAAFKSLKELSGTKTGRYSSRVTSADIVGRDPLPGWKDPKIRTPFDPFAGSGFKVVSGVMTPAGGYLEKYFKYSQIQED